MIKEIILAICLVPIAIAGIFIVSVGFFVGVVAMIYYCFIFPCVLFIQIAFVGVPLAEVIRLYALPF